MIRTLNELEVITLFVEDLPAVKTFYADVFGLELISKADPAGHVWEIAQVLSDP